MPWPEVVLAFDEHEFLRARGLLARKVAYMGTRKFEEGDWSDVYAAARGLPNQGWSNLHLDVVSQGRGIEHKMRGTGEQRPRDLAGRTLIHPAATRSIRVPTPDTPAEEAKNDVLGQYADLIRERTERVAETALDHTADVRTGWLLWKGDLSEFLYFEEELLPPDPSLFTAKWNTRQGTGARKSNENLWIFDKENASDGSPVKRYSVTGGDAGAKIQPYFRVPPLGTDGLYHFTPQGAEHPDGGGRILTWVQESTATQLLGLAGDLDGQGLDEFVDNYTDALLTIDPDEYEPEARELSIGEAAYQHLRTALPRNTDDERFRSLLRVALALQDTDKT